MIDNRVAKQGVRRNTKENKVGNEERILLTGTPRQTKLEPWEYYDHEASYGIVSEGNGAIGRAYPAWAERSMSRSLGGFGESPFQGAIDLLKSSVWAKLAVIGSTILILYNVYKKKEGR